MPFLNQHKSLLRYLLTMLVGAFFLSTILLPAVTQAQQSGWNLLLIPNKKEYVAWPGETIRGSILVRNDGDVALENLAAVAVDFGPNDQETGDPRIIEDTDDPYTYRLAPWVSFSQDPLTIPANGSVEFEYEINVPEDAEPGGHYGMIYIQQLAQGDGQTALGILSKIGSLLLVTVRGEVQTEGDLIEFYTGKQLYEYLPVDFYTRLQNIGNVHFTPVGTIFIYDWRDQLVGTVPINEGGGSVLPESIRRYQSFWNEAFITNPFALDEDGQVARDDEGNRIREININWEDWDLFRIGRYTARALVVYEDYDGIEKQLDATTRFWVFPWKLLLMILVGIFVAIFGIRWLMRWYNDRLISRYEQGKGGASKEMVEELRKKRRDMRQKRANRRKQLRERLRLVKNRGQRLLRWNSDRSGAESEGDASGGSDTRGSDEGGRPDVFKDPDRTDE